MAEVTTIVVRTEFGDVPRATEALRGLSEQAKATEASTRSVGTASAEVGRSMQTLVAAEQQIVAAVRDGNLALIEGRTSLEDYTAGVALAHEMARKLGVSAGSELGQLLRDTTAAMVYAQAEGRNLSNVLREMDGTASEVAIAAERVATSTERAAASTTATGVRATAASRQVNLLNNALRAVAFQAAGVNPALGRLATVLAGFAVNAGVMAGVLGGLALLSLAWKKIAEDAREAREAQQTAIDTLERLIAARNKLGPEAEFRAAIAPNRARMLEIEGEIARRRAQLDTPGVASEQTSQRIAALQQEYAELSRLVKQGEREITEIRREALREQLRADYEAAGDRAAARERALAEEIEARRELNKLLAETKDLYQRVNEAGRGLEISKLSDVIIGTRDPADLVGRPSVAGDVTGRAVLSEGARDYWADRWRDFNDGADEAAAKAQRVRDAWIVALSAIGNAVGGVAQDIAGIASGALAGFSSGGPVGAFVGGGAALLGALSGVGGGDAARQWELAEAVERSTDALKEFAASLVETTRLADLQSQGLDLFRQNVRDILSSFVAAGGEFSVSFSGLDDKLYDLAVAGTPAADILAQIARVSGLSAEQTAALVHALELYIDAAQEVEAWRKREVQSMTEDVNVRILRAQGLGPEADALARQYERQRELASARELEDAALVELIETLHQLEDAAIAAAQAFREDQFGLDISARDAVLRGDNREAGRIRLEMQQRDELRGAEGIFGAGAPELMELVNIHGREMTKWLEDFDAELARGAEIAQKAALAEQFRAQVDMQNLELRLLQARGMGEAAAELRQFMEIEEALFQGRSTEYLALLELVHVEEDRARQLQAQAVASQNLFTSIDRVVRETERFASALNAPSGFNLPFARFGTLDTRPQQVVNNFGGLTIVVAKGEDPRETWNRIKAVIESDGRAGGGGGIIP